MLRPLTAIVAALLCCIGCVPAQRASDLRLPIGIDHTGFAADRLWLQLGEGTLSSFDLGEGTERAESAPGRVADFCVEQNNPVIITAESGVNWDIPKTRTLWRQDGKSDWERLASGLDANFLALACAGDRIAVLGRHALLLIGPERRQTVDLKKDLYIERMPGHVTATLLAQDHLFVGYTSPLGGGGLQRIDLKTGDVVDLMQNVEDADCDIGAGQSCEYANSILSSVQSIIPSPFNPTCVIIAEGGWHLGPMGDLQEVCAKRIHRFYEGAPADKDLIGAVSFYDLAHSGEMLLAVGVDGLYAFARDGKARLDGWPKLTKLGSIYINRDYPGVVLVARKGVAGGDGFSAPRIIPLGSH